MFGSLIDNPYSNYGMTNDGNPPLPSVGSVYEGDQSGEGVPTVLPCALLINSLLLYVRSSL